MKTNLPNDTNAETPADDQHDQYASFGIAPSGTVIYDRENPAAWVSSDTVRENEP